jgi:hypothetical protein
MNQHFNGIGVLSEGNDIGCRIESDCPLGAGDLSGENKYNENKGVLHG